MSPLKYFWIPNNTADPINSVSRAFTNFASRDSRLMQNQQLVGVNMTIPNPPLTLPIAPNVFNRTVIRRKNAITVDLQPYETGRVVRDLRPGYMTAKINPTAEKRVSSTPNLSFKRKKDNTHAKGRTRYSVGIARESRHTLSSEDTDLSIEDQNDVNVNIDMNIESQLNTIVSQAAEYLNDGRLDKHQYDTLMYQVTLLQKRVQLNEAMPTDLSIDISQTKSFRHPMTVDEKSKSLPPVVETPAPEKLANSGSSVLGNMNVNDLFAKLVATGIIPVPSEVKKEESKVDITVVEKVKQEPRRNKSTIHRVDIMIPATLRVKQPDLVSQLYSGMSCSSCSMRFPLEHTLRYSQHLDWHFHQNRRERESRGDNAQNWYHNRCDWLRYVELDDPRGGEERDTSCFEATSTADGRTVEPSVAAPANPSLKQSCALCGDVFAQFFNEDMEEWHLRNALKHHSNYYHPLCFKDYNQQSNAS